MLDPVRILNLQRKVIAVVTIIYAASVAGCVTRSVTKPQGEGYGLITFSKTTDLIHWGMTSHVYYWDDKGHRTRVWYSRHYWLVDDKDIALFDGDNGELFAVHGSGPVIDITDEVKLIWAKASGLNFDAVRRSAGIYSATKHDHSFTVRVGFAMGEKGNVEFSREQILALIDKAKQKGVRLVYDHNTHKGMPYLKLALDESETN
ncbi:MAG: hypothetical protein ABSH11_01720 [Verrucomicrobiota bacterium]|jgi:hypothetical protein